MNYQEIARAYSQSGELFSALVGKVILSDQVLLLSACADVKSAVVKAMMAGYTGKLPVKTARQRKLAIVGMSTLQNDLSELASLCKIGRDALVHVFDAQLTRNASTAHRKSLLGDSTKKVDGDTGDTGDTVETIESVDVTATIVAATDDLLAENTRLQTLVDLLGTRVEALNKEVQSLNSQLYVNINLIDDMEAETNAMTALIESVREATNMKAVRALLAG